MIEFLAKYDTNSDSYELISGRRRAEVMLQAFDGAIQAKDVETNEIITLVKRDGKLVKARVQ